ncbi:conserved hypothetical protein [Catenulispora acidiphila DSM 44928]|uniref:Avidin family protein n=1 Tax=Catenulispora acidiphila (strain DSM 44928 / JCM 14897 / NBRC 102108 / NRRL B-24433 / ID139908) TaxID=479433 RepID=C7PWM7_CATAD|nr:avidin/streptavidin family protein [Catenulispora acidiphila]ACU75307.1 conserved hypothetical protein [Catenulispora acidiphila DSM 44928]
MWVGTWHNQYGSRLTITDESDHRIQGSFRTALGDSAFAGEEAEISGIHQGECITFNFSTSSATGESICSFTGLLREGKLQTLWHVVSDSAVKPPAPGEQAQLMKLPWAHAVLTNADTFTRDS